MISNAGSTPGGSNGVIEEGPQVLGPVAGQSRACVPNHVLNRVQGLSQERQS